MSDPFVQVPNREHCSCLCALIIPRSSAHVKSSALSSVAQRSSSRQTGAVNAQPSATGTRARVRAELTNEIKEIARRHLAEHGAESLSLRAVARELGMVSSAVYRYFPSRDHLLTALIVDSFEAVGTAAVQADAPLPRDDFPGRWMAITRAIRSWALANPREYALVYGSPISGYVAPPDTIDPALQVILAFIRLLVDATVAGAVIDNGPLETTRMVRSDLAAIRASIAPNVPDTILAEGLVAWMTLFGSISYELFGHFENVINDRDGYFDLQMRRVGTTLFNGN